MNNPFQDKVRIGILGGGQLGRMMIQSSVDFDLHIAALDPNPKAPCHTIASEFVQGDFRNYEAVYEFGRKQDVLTIEIEHVNPRALKQLVQEGVHVCPSPEALQLIQDKGLQKKFYQEHGIPTSAFVLVEGIEQIRDHLSFLPAFQKTRKAGYDGQGVQSLTTEEDLPNAFEAPSLLEKRVDFEKELSVLVARTSNGQAVTYPPVEMIFNQDANLVEYLLSPARIDETIARRAKEIALNVANKLDIVGLLAVEMFVTKDQKVLVNEAAPRPHNSGHHTIEGNVTSQFEQHLRAIVNLPLGDTSVIHPAVMVNLLGEPGYNGLANYKGIEEALGMKGAHVHLYGKKETRPYRKMGHVTIVDPDLEQALTTAKQIQQTIKVIT